MSTNPWAQWLSDHGSNRYQLSRKAGWNAFANAAPRPSFPVLSRAEADRLEEEIREDYDEARHVWNTNLPTVRTQQLSHSFSLLEQVMASGRRDGDRLRGAAVIDAEPGLGKTTIATRFGRQVHRRELRRFGPRTSAGHQRLPVAFVPLSAGTTLKGLNQQLLEFYGHPGATRATRTRLTSLATDCVVSCETRLIIFDDLHFVDFRHRDGIEVSNHLKTLANLLPATFIYVGVNLQARRFFDDGFAGENISLAQTARRTSRIPVTPFTYSSEAGRRAWHQMLTALESHVLLASGGPGLLTQHADELFRRTQGRVASLTSLIDRACYLAITTGEEDITASVLGAALNDNAAQRLARPA